MKEKKTAPRLFKIESGKTPPKKQGKQSTAIEKISKALKNMKIGDSFLIKYTQESTVRNIIKNGAAAFKIYTIRISKAEEGKDYKRVFRLDNKRFKEVLEGGKRGVKK